MIESGSNSLNFKYFEHKYENFWYFISLGMHKQRIRTSEFTYEKIWSEININV